MSLLVSAIIMNPLNLTIGQALERNHILFGAKKLEQRVDNITNLKEVLGAMKLTNKMHLRNIET